MNPIYQVPKTQVSTSTPYSGHPGFLLMDWGGEVSFFCLRSLRVGTGLRHALLILLPQLLGGLPALLGAEAIWPPAHLSLPWLLPQPCLDGHSPAPRCRDGLREA